MDGSNFRNLCRGHVHDLSEVMLRMHNEEDSSVKCVIKCLHDLVLASLERNNTVAMRAPLIRLMNTIAEHQWELVVQTATFEILLLARAFATSAKKVVDISEPAVRAGAAQPARSLDDLLAQFAIPNANADEEEAAETPHRPIGRRRKRQPKQLMLSGGTSATSVDSPTAATAKRAPSASAVQHGNPKQVQPVARLSLPPPRPTNSSSNSVMRGGKRKCEHCDLYVAVDRSEQLKHAWKKHKDQVYKFMSADLVCDSDFCDYVGSTTRATRIHEGKIHGMNPPPQEVVISELEAGDCIYCGERINNLVYFKQHMLECEQRDERPALGCSSCLKTFHFTYDFVTHLRTSGGIEHGRPVLLRDD